MTYNPAIKTRRSQRYLCKHCIQPSCSCRDNWAYCKECHAKITWTLTTKEKMMPVDGHVVAIHFEPGAHIAHWETCPAASKFRKDDGGGPGKRSEVKPEPRPLNLNFGEPPEEAKARWAAKPPHKTPEGVLAKEKEIFRLGHALIRAGMSKEQLQQICLEIAGVAEAKHLRYNSQQTMQRVIDRFEEELNAGN